MKRFLIITIFFILFVQTIFSQTTINRTVNLDFPDFHFELFSNGSSVAENEILYINTTPEMPDMIGRIYCDNPNLNFDVKIRFRYRKYCFDDPNESTTRVNAYCRGNNPVRDEVNYFPANDQFQTISASNDWDINQLLGTNFVGGEAIITWKLTGSSFENTFIFHIRANNPTVNTIKTELDQISNNLWFIKKMVREESDYLQFNGGTASTDLTNSSKCPNWGWPDGWGLMQKDPPNSENDLWDWQQNIETGWNFLNVEKRSIAETGWNSSINNYYEYLDRYPSYSNPNSTTVWTAGNETFAFNPGSGQRSAFDGCWIKAYNGVSGGENVPNPQPDERTSYQGYYYIWKNLGSDANTPYWDVQNSNSNNRDYVSDVCNNNV